jgi:hypothetical protein
MRAFDIPAFDISALLAWFHFFELNPRFSPVRWLTTS